MLAVCVVDAAAHFLVGRVEEQSVNLQLAELALQAQRPFNGDTVEAEVVAIKHSARYWQFCICLTFFSLHVYIGYSVAVFFYRAVACAKVFAQLREGLGSINQLYATTTGVRFLVCKQPYVGGNSGVVENVVRKLYNTVHEVLLHKIAANVALATSGIACEERRTIVDACRP